jgi:hypothetical protein
MARLLYFNNTWRGPDTLEIACGWKQEAFHTGAPVLISVGIVPV